KCRILKMLLHQMLMKAMKYKDNNKQYPLIKTYHMQQHTYTTSITWTGNRGAGTMDYRAYSRDFDINIQEKVKILGSSDSIFNGDGTKHNPEDLLVSAVSS